MCNETFVLCSDRDTQIDHMTQLYTEFYHLSGHCFDFKAYNFYSYGSTSLHSAVLFPHATAAVSSEKLW